MADIDELCVNTLRFLAADAVQQAKSGHPGMPLGAAPMAYVLWDRFLKHNPRDPNWFDRDRFVLSAGHASALLYSLLHMYGYDFPLEEVKNFRQWGSISPGHPEAQIAHGVEVTTGPLGQGFGMGVGLALAERFLAAQFNTTDDNGREYNVVDHYTYGICSDGDLMEGISSEAASLAGHLKLSKLIYLYDDNDISIEGSTDLAFTENVVARFESYDWQVLEVDDGNDLAAIEQAIHAAQGETQQPSLIIVRTHIGYGSPKQDDAAAHGAPLGGEALDATKDNLGWPRQPRFYIPDEAREHMQRAITQGADCQTHWEKLLEDYEQGDPERAATFALLREGQLPPDWDADIPVFHPDDGPQATRSSSGAVLNALVGRLPNLVGGSADLAPSNNTRLDGYGDMSPDQPGARNIHFGVREHAMAAIVNGMAQHGGIIPFGATFLVFSDYMRPALRIAAMMKAPSIFVFTHDSIGVGEDGPTHQPIEQLASLRCIPNMTVLRPADANETAAAWLIAIQRAGPVALVLSRQKLPVLDPDKYPVAAGVGKGAYVLADTDHGQPEIILVGTGSEVMLCLAACEELTAQGVAARVVSMPSWELFKEQHEAYQREVLPADVPKLAVEAGATQGWHKYVGSTGEVIGLDRFGASAPGDVVMEKLGFSVDNVVKRALVLIEHQALE